MTNVFNSLGSNYDLKFILEALVGKKSDSEKLQSYLENKYQGKAILVYKGREALGLALNLLNLPKNTSVAINGFTCYAVYEAISKAGYKTEYLDLEDLDLNFSANIFESKLKANPNIKVLIIQNTLGYPGDVGIIAKICQQNKVILIEDLAHSVGTVYDNNREAGTVGDLVALSFSQDKMIDAVSGGALIIRNQNYQKINSLKLGEITNKQQAIDRLYPLFTYLIRTTYGLALGKIIHAVLKKVNLLSSPMGDPRSSGPHKLPDWYRSLAYNQLKGLPSSLKHRQEVASIYAANINPKILSQTVIKQIANSTNLRFPIFVAGRANLIKYLRHQGIHVADIWYDAPLAPKKYLSSTDYQGQCPESERISSRILNLPTHRNVSIAQAQEITRSVNRWLELP